MSKGNLSVTWSPFLTLIWSFYDDKFSCNKIAIRIRFNLFISRKIKALILKNLCIDGHIIIIITIFIRLFCPKAGPSLQAEKPRLQFYRRHVFQRKPRNKGCSFTRDLIGAIASRCFPHPTLSLSSEQILKDLKRSQGHQWGGEECGFG